MSLVMDFLNMTVNPLLGTTAEIAPTLGKVLTGASKDVQNVTKNVPGANVVGRDVVAPVLGSYGRTESDTGAALAGQNPFHGTVGQQAGQIGGDIVNTVAPAVAPGVGGLAEKAVGGVAGTIAKGAAEGATFGGPSNLAQGAASGDTSPGKLTMDFLQGAGIGAAAGGATAGIAPAIKGAVGSVAKPVYAANASDMLGPDGLQKLADTDNQKTVEKTLTPVTGPVVAKEFAASVAEQKDPAIIKNMIDNNLNNKLSTPQQSATPGVTGANPAVPSPEPIPPTTPETNVNTPQQVAEQGNALSQPTPEEQSLNEKQPEPDFMNAPGEKNSTKVGKLGATKGMTDILNSGGTVDEAMNHYMETTGGDYGEAQDAVQKIMEGDSGLPLNKGRVNASLNPQSEGIDKILPEVQSGDIQQPIKNAQAMQNEVIRRGQIASDATKQLDAHDLQLMEQLRGNKPQAIASQAHDPQAFTDAANKVKSYNDFTQAAGSGFAGQNVPYRQDYGAPILLDNSTQSVAAQDALKAKLATDPGYAKGRKFDNYEDYAQEGIGRRNENFGQDLEEDIQRRASGLSQLTLSKGLNEALPGQVKTGEIGADENGVYRQLNIPGGSKISIPQEYADQINNRAPVPDATGALGGYDKLNSNYKNIKLAGGGFHSINVTGSYVAHQLASGQFLKDPTGITGMIKSTLSDSAFKNEVENWGQNGRLLDMDAAGLQHSGVTSQADIKPSGVLGKIPVLKQIHEAVFDRQIPYMKMKIFDQETQGLDRNNPEDLTKMKDTAAGLNKAFGGLNRSFEGFTPKQFKVLSRVFLATDYNEGQLRTLGNAFTSGGAEGKLARQIVFGKALLWAGLATAGGAVGGEFNNKTPKQVALDIIQKTVDPRFQFGNYTVGLPTSQVSELGKPITETVSNAINGRSLTNPTKDFASARLAAIPSGLEQLQGNRNYSGNAIYGKDYYGRPISAGATAENLASMVSPIPVAQGLQAGSGAENAGAAAVNIAGLRATPTNNLNYAPISGQTYVQRLKAAGLPDAQIQADTQFFDQIDSVTHNKSKVLTQAETAIAAKNPQKAQQLIDSYNQKLIASLKPWAQSGGEQYFDSTMLQLLQQEMIKFKTASSNVSYLTKTNPTSIGVPIGALASQPATIKGGQ